MKLTSLNQKMNDKARRTFLKESILLGTGIIFLPTLTGCSNEPDSAMVLEPQNVLGLKTFDGEDYLENGQWFACDNVNDGFYYEFPIGSLVDKKFITTDMLADGNTLLKFNIELQEGESGRVFQFAFGVLNQCSLRVRLPLSLVDQNTWRMPREGAFLKPMCWGDRVDLNKVDRMKLYIHRKSKGTSRFCMTPVFATQEEIPVIEHPVLPKGKLLDAVGQSTIHDWDGKTKSTEEMISNLINRLENANHSLPQQFSKWGGWKDRRVDQGTGFFRVHKDDNRWWFVDPEGYLFWSSGVDCVRVDTTADIYLLEDALEFLPAKEGEFADIFTEGDMGHTLINYLAANYIRVFGSNGWKEKWASIALDELRRLRFNTVGNWSEWEYATKASFPYVRPMNFTSELTNDVYRDFPDVFHPDFEKDADTYAQALSNTIDDPALIGYFMMNEPKWAFSSELPAIGMLYNTAACATRTQLASFLKDKYTSNEELASTWDMTVDFTKIEKGKWTGEFTDEALTDLEAFSEIMVEKYFGTLSAACKKVDPNHLNLGIRYAGVPPRWAVAGMKSFDVFSMNNYREKVPFNQTKEIHDLLHIPVVIGEWHFGALDVGLPASGIGHVLTQEDRGKAYRVYFEDAAANPYCIGVHWFTLYDQSAIGRFDGENYNIGFIDVCNQPHHSICDAAIKSHEEVYEIAEGKKEPYDNSPDYLPKLFL